MRSESVRVPSESDKQGTPKSEAASRAELTEIRGVVVAQIGGLNAPVPTAITESVTIERWPPVEFVWIADRQMPYLGLMGQYDHECVAIRGVTARMPHLREVLEALDEVVLRMRLLGPGVVGWRVAHFIPDGASAQATPGTIPEAQRITLWANHYMVWERSGIPSVYACHATEMVRLQSLFQKTDGRKLMRHRPFQLFYRAYHEPYATDRFLSNAVALEGLLLSDGNDRSSLKYKFADRGSYLLCRALPEDCDPSYYADRLGRIYDARSALVHPAASRKKQSKDVEADWDQPSELDLLWDSERFLRALLLYVIEHPEFEEAAAVDDRKRQLYRNTGGLAREGPGQGGS